MIGICIGIKNRTEMLRKWVLPSLDKMAKKDQILLSFYDCGSEDGLKEAIEDSWKGPLIFTSHQERFTRSHSLNNAVIQCACEKVFLCDADMVLPVNFVDQFELNVGPGKVWFPICFTLRKVKPPEIDPTFGWWRESGLGMVGIRRDDFMALGGLSLSFTDWGGEDGDLFNRCKTAGYQVTRENCHGLFHVWHPRQAWV
jgi:hypothetical protein